MCPRMVSLVLSCVLLVTLSIAFADIPRLITYQGRLTDDTGNPVDDKSYELEFAIYADSLVGDPLWSEDQLVEVVGGLFNVQLGVESALPDSIFTIYSGLFVGMQLAGFPEFSPRTRLTSSAFCYRALHADTADVVLGGGSGWVDVGTRVHLLSDADSVGIGTTSPAYKLDVNGDVNINSAYRIGGETVLRIDNESIVAGDHAGSTDLPDLATIIGSYAGNAGGAWECTFVGHQAGYTSTDECNTFIGASAGKHNIDGYNNVFVGAHAGDGALGYGNVFLGYYAGWQETGNGKLIVANSPSATIPLIWGDFVSGRVALGTTSPFAKFTVIADGTAIHAEVSGSFGGNAVIGKANAPSGTGLKGMSMGEDGRGVYGKAEGLYGFGVYGEATLAGVGVYGDGKSIRGIGVKGVSELGSGAGVVGAADGANGWGVAGYADGEDGRGVYGKAQYDDAIGMYAEATGLRGRAFYGKADKNGGVGLEVRAMGSGGVGIIAKSGSGGTGAKIYGNVLLYSNVDESLIMELGEGLDYAEGFDVSGESTIAPGTVLSIDPDHPGELMVCTSAYDSRVAGIVTGANGLGSGVRLGANGYDHDVALAGRVYCNVDASAHGIEPGDLLTTSAVPGYAMKATDHAHAQGAILGKAMEKLEQGQTGQILVLVTLQ